MIHRLLWCGAACLALVACAPEGIPTEVADIVISLPEGAGAVTSLPDISANPAILGAAPARQALAKALLRDPAIVEQAALVDVTVANINLAKNGFYPSFSLSAQTGARVDTNGTATTEPALALSAQQMLLDFGATDRAVARQVINAGLGHLDFLGAVDAMLKDLLIQSAHLRHDTAAIDLTRTHMDGLSDIAALQAARDSAGFASAPDQLDMTRSLTDAAADLARMEADAARAGRRLAQLTGSATPLPQTLTLADCQREATPLPLLASALTQEAAALGVTDTDRARLPTLYLDGGVQQPFSGESASVAVNLRLDTDLFSGGLAARRAAARANLAAADAATARAHEDASVSRSDAMAELGDLARQAAAEAQDVATLAQMQGLYRDQYGGLGTRSLTDLLGIASEYHAAQLDVLSTTRDQEIALITCVAAQSGLRDALDLSQAALHGLTLHP